MERYKVIIYPTAQQDFKEVIGYLNTLSPEVAQSYYDLLTTEIHGLSHMPERCPHVRDLAMMAKGYRYLIVKNYLIFYVVQGDTVQIRRIQYARREYLSLL